MPRKRRPRLVCARTAALVLLAAACGPREEDAEGRLGDWTRDTRHIAALNTAEPIFYSEAAGGERLTLNCGGISRSEPVTMIVEAARGRPFGSARQYDRANDRPVRYATGSGEATLRANLSADAVGFYADGPGNQGEALPRLADSRRFALDFTDLEGRRRALSFPTEGAGAVIRRLRDLCRDTLSYKLTPP